ncbi:hypothetical protein SAY86_020116 [Trapa natans]|uniref:Uncharacterized protein n=1 Tax=Trapa natans TaxID=22666 RepID=A0AAN7LYU2_TRANT|nr:hypothetical protein SAY86_020116 [Trapa natans]
MNINYSCINSSTSSSLIAARGRGPLLGRRASTGAGPSSRVTRVTTSISPGERSHNKKTSRNLITIGTSHGRGQSNWSCDYLVSLEDLRLGDLVEEEDDGGTEDGRRKKRVNGGPDVHVNLSIEKHASFGLSIDGRIATSFSRKCSHCSSPYRRQVDASFKVWVLPSVKSSNPDVELPDIGGDDPSVIYVKPGSEAHLDSLVQDTLRLTVSVNDTCSETCARSEPVHYIGRERTASIDQRWSRLLELRNGKGG